MHTEVPTVCLHALTPRHTHTEHTQTMTRAPLLITNNPPALTPCPPLPLLAWVVGHFETRARVCVLSHTAKAGIIPRS